MGCCRFIFGGQVHGGLSEDLGAVVGGAQLPRGRRDRGVLAPRRGTRSAGSQERGLTSAVAVSDTELAQWFPDGRRKVSEEYDQPDLSRVLASMKQNRHFTLLLAWRRYIDTKNAGKKYGYSQFCALFTDYLRTHDL